MRSSRGRARFRISSTNDAPTVVGENTAHSDTFPGRFVKLVPTERVAEGLEFETEDPAMRGEMTITISLADGDGGTDVVAVQDRLPRGFSPAETRSAGGFHSTNSPLVEAG